MLHFFSPNSSKQLHRSINQKHSTDLLSPSWSLFSTLLTAAGCLLASSGSLFVSGKPVVATKRGAALEGYKIVDIQWKGFLEPGKPEFTFSGNSLDDVEEQVKAINPNYSIFTQQNATEEAHIAARQTEAVHCGWPPGWGYASEGPAWDGVRYLQGISGSCRLGPGPGTCSRVSCSWASGIYYCNDNPEEHWEPCRWIGDVASQIINDCSIRLDGGYVLGQAFDYRRWNTIVAYGEC